MANKQTKTQRNAKRVFILEQKAQKHLPQLKDNQAKCMERLKGVHIDEPKAPKHA